MRPTKLCSIDALCKLTYMAYRTHFGDFLTLLCRQDNASFRLAGTALHVTKEKPVTDGLIDRNPDILGGTPVFSGTRVPVRILMEHLEAGDRLDEFLEDYPTVSRSQAIALLERAKGMLVSDTDEVVA